MKLTNKRIGVLMGGRSAEREISLRSGMAVYDALKRLKYDVVAIDVGHNISDVLKKKKIDIAFITLHGGFGENGAIQGMLEVLGIPYTGSGILASALAMDKEASKKVFLHNKIPIPPYAVINDKSSVLGSHSRTIVNFPMPWVIKPATEGSSIGVSIVKEEGQFNSAVEKAFSLSNRVIIEKYIRGKEVHIGILNGKVLGGVEVKPSLEFYNYEAKYTMGKTEYILPPGINSKVYEMTKEIALRAHTSLGCKGATRVDLKINKMGKPYVLEVNTIPGMTETSLLPKIANEAGMDFPSLIEEILRGAIVESKKRKR
ncbi:MAG: D-alanine--D-alanine ligase [Nitrospirae bacterium]|nr:D-alanine--D-alanine ligase [Nitrospirota bacterium]